MSYCNRLGLQMAQADVAFCGSNSPQSIDLYVNWLSSGSFPRLLPRVNAGRTSGTGIAKALRRLGRSQWQLG